MTHDHEATFRRRQDGSIDIDFYARRAALLRSVERRQALARWFAIARRTVTSLITGGAPGVTPKILNGNS